MAGYNVKFKEPNREFSGTYLSVQFERGDGFTESKYLAEKFREKGLSVEKNDERQLKAKVDKASEVL